MNIKLFVLMLARLAHHFVQYVLNSPVAPGG